ncbi:M14 family zinc carboxypeptidase [Streptomyces sp. NPDC047315]|uniref:M14 family zinc carboxypeptidase n=1 Tax=Streptomyces sp. NPDC047315 TaxID=3155142 RepID=UPI0033F31732
MRRFPTYDELHRTVRAVARAHPARVELSEVGKSRGGRDIFLASVGKGRKNVLVLGGPHANEPTGFLTVIHLAHLAAKHPEFAEGLDVTWHFVPCMDPDAMRLGEGWYGAPRTIRNYYGRFYRPAFVHQPEWSFPVDGGFDRPLPETRALMSIIDDLRPNLVYTLHSADFTGHQFMVTDAVPELVSGVEHAMARRGLPVHTAPSDGGTPTVGRTATVAEYYQLLSMRFTLSLRTGGMLLQLLEGAGANGENAVRNWFDFRCAQMRHHFPGRALDLRELTALQMEVGLAAARCL